MASDARRSRVTFTARVKGCELGHPLGRPRQRPLVGQSWTGSRRANSGVAIGAVYRRLPLACIAKLGPGTANQAFRGAERSGILRSFGAERGAELHERFEAFKRRDHSG